MSDDTFYCRSSLHPLKFNSTHPHCKDTSLCDAKWLLIIMLVLILHRIMKAAAAAVTRFATVPQHVDAFVCEKGASCICIVREFNSQPSRTERRLLYKPQPLPFTIVAHSRGAKF